MREKMIYTQDRYLSDLQKARKEMLDSISADVSIYMNKVNDCQTKRAEAIKKETK